MPYTIDTENISTRKSTFIHTRSYRDQTDKLIGNRVQLKIQVIDSVEPDISYDFMTSKNQSHPFLYEIDSASEKATGSSSEILPS